MKGDAIPDQDHVTRLCGGSHLREDGTIAPTALCLRQGEIYLSVNWLECLELPSRDLQVAEVGRVLAGKRSFGSMAKLAVLNVGDIHTAHVVVGNAFTALEVRHEPEIEPPDVSHSGIHGIRTIDLLLHDHLAKIVLDALPAKPALS